MTDLSYEYLLGYYRGITGLGDKDVLNQAVKTIADYCRGFEYCKGCRYSGGGCMLRSSYPLNWRTK